MLTALRARLTEGLLDSDRQFVTETQVEMCSGVTYPQHP